MHPVLPHLFLSEKKKIFSLIGFPKEELGLLLGKGATYSVIKAEAIFTFILFYVCGCFTCLYACLVPAEARRVFFGTGVTESWELLCRC